VIRRHLIIVAPDRIAFRDLADHLPPGYEVHIDRRWGERRRGEPRSHAVERRRGDRRRHDVSEELRREGWALIPAEQREGPAAP
jgi:hypothetical protein